MSDGLLVDGAWGTLSTAACRAQNAKEMPHEGLSNLVVSTPVVDVHHSSLGMLAAAVLGLLAAIVHAVGRCRGATFVSAPIANDVPDSRLGVLAAVLRRLPTIVQVHR